MKDNIDWLYLGIAILSEVIATTALKSVQGISKMIPLILVIGGYTAAFYFLSLSLRSIPIGISYAVWSGAGIVLVSIGGWYFYQQKLDLPALLGIGLIVIGVLVLKLFSRAITSD